MRAHLANLTPSRPFMHKVDPENFHLTLRFIGTVDGYQLRDIDLALSRISHPPLALRADQPGWFGTSKNVRAIIFRIHKANNLSLYITRLCAVCINTDCHPKHGNIIPISR